MASRIFYAHIAFILFIASVFLILGCQGKPTSQSHASSPATLESQKIQSTERTTRTNSNRNAAKQKVDSPEQHKDVVRVRTVSTVKDPSLQLATVMQAFITSLYKNDEKAFLSFFSKEKPWVCVNTLEPPYQHYTVHYAELAKEILPKDGKGWHEVFFDAGGDDTFRDYAVMYDGKPWKKAKNSIYVPPEYDWPGSVYVKWRKEKGNWVIDEIGFPSA